MAFCDHFITHEELGSTDQWAGTACKLPAGHAGPHSALYADESSPIHVPKSSKTCASCHTDDVADGEKWCGWCAPHELLKEDHDRAVAAMHAGQRFVQFATHLRTCERILWPQGAKACTCGFEAAEAAHTAAVVAYEENAQPALAHALSTDAVASLCEGSDDVSA